MSRKKIQDVLVLNEKISLFNKKKSKLTSRCHYEANICVYSRQARSRDMITTTV